eukprot:m51a1_g14754 putative selenide, water dikinase (754) ;mRNA; f:329478-332317
METVYLDYNATTPIDAEVVAAMTPCLRECFGNPSSSHPFGRAAKLALEHARSQVADLLGCVPSEVLFTSGGTESNNTAIKGVVLAAMRARPAGSPPCHVITSAVDHPAVLQVCEWLKTQGVEVTVVPVDSTGRVAPDDVAQAIRPGQTVLVTVMHSNNEVGTLQPIAELTAIAHRAGALMHTDAAQSIGKVPVRVPDLGVDLLSIAGHKLYAPKGIGALYVRSGVRLDRVMHGADQEAGRRAGTENVLLSVGLGQACAVSARDLAANAARMRRTRDRLHESVRAALGDESVRLNGHAELRLPNTLSLSFRGVDASALLSEVGERVAASAGAACHSGEARVSSVLRAMRVPTEWAMGTVRLSVGRETTDAQVDAAAAVLVAAVRRLQPAAQPSAPAASDDGDLPAVDSVKMTQYTRGLGCACKLRAQALERLLEAFVSPRSDPRVVVGTETRDDAAVFQLTPDLALALTVDVLGPVCDDAYTFGAVCAANALSDVYAMGATPAVALGIAAWPASRLPIGSLERVVRGAADKAAEAGICIAGGHTTDDVEPKYGLAVVGTLHPSSAWRNCTAKVGDALVLTKPIGSGIISTAVKKGICSSAVVEEMLRVVCTLNRGAAEAVVAAGGPSAVTDVTGFGLLGHLHEMAAGSKVDVAIRAGAVPLLPEARELAAAGAVPGGSVSNAQFVAPFVSFADSVSAVDRTVLADAQTSGGLLVAIPKDRAQALVRELEARKTPAAAIIGEVVGVGRGAIAVSP